MKRSDDQAEPPDATDAVLRRGLRTEPLSAQALERIRVATERQWRATMGHPIRSSHWQRHAGIAAALALMAVGIGLFIGTRPGSSNVVLGTLARADYPGAVELRRWSPDKSVASGARLHAGERILVRGGARIVLADANVLRLAAGTGVEILSAQQVRLLDGSVYLDIAPGSAHRDLAVQTPAGTFTHVGTQFQVAVQDGQTLLGVREGQVRWHSTAGDVLVDAGTRLTIDRDGKATREQASATGTGWAWAENLAASFDIEDKSLADFLRYVARETGRKLVFADAAIQARARATILHGSANDLAPVDALAAVMATTSMRFALGSDSIRIESGGDPGRTTK